MNGQEGQEWSVNAGGQSVVEDLRTRFMSKKSEISLSTKLQDASSKKTENFKFRPRAQGRGKQKASGLAKDKRQDPGQK